MSSESQNGNQSRESTLGGKDYKGEIKKFSFLEYEVGGWGALLALVISLVTLSLSAVDRWFLDANPVIYPPQKVEFNCSYTNFDANPPVCPEGHNTFLLATPVTLVNDTSAPHAFTVVNMDVELRFLGARDNGVHPLIFNWFYFGDDEDVSYITLAPQQSFSRQVQFFPRRIFNKNGEADSSNFIRFRDFEKTIVSGNAKQIELTFVAELLGKGKITTKCYIPIDAELVDDAKKSSFYSHRVNCFAQPIF